MKENYHEILAKKITEALSDHYTRCYTAKNRGATDYFSVNEKLVQKIEQVLKDYKLNKEKYGK
jgi:hypothetical protein